MRSQVYVTVVRPSVRLSVCPIIRTPHSTATGLLLCARRTGNIDRLLHNRRSAAAAPQQHVAQQQTNGSCSIHYFIPDAHTSLHLK